MSSRSQLAPVLAAVLLPWGAAWAQSAGAGDAAAGSAAGSAREASFQASMSAGAGRARSIDLTNDGRSSGSARLGFNLTWNIRSRLTNLYASISTFYNEVFADNAFSTYGAAGGLGWSRQIAPTRTWRVTSRLSFVPDQDIPRPRVSEGIQDPTIRNLVPRNGFLALDLDGGLDMTLSESSSLGISGVVSSRRFDVYSVEMAEGENADDLVDQREAGADVSWSIKSSPRNSWSVSSTAKVIGLGDDPAGSGDDEDTRLQVGLSGSFRRALSLRSSLSVSSGYSAIDNSSGDSRSTPTLNVGWGWTGEHLSSRLSLNRSQAIFIGSTEAVDNNNLAGNLEWHGKSQSLSLLGGYSLSREAGEDSGSADTRTRNLSVSYSRQGRSWGWFATLFNYRQSSDVDFAGSLVSSGAAAGLSWQLKGGRS